MSASTPRRIERCTDAGAWDELVASSPHGSVNTTSTFINALDIEHEFWLIRDGTRIAGGAVIFLEAGQPRPAPCPYQGVMLADWVAAMPAHRRTKYELDTVALLLDELATRYRRLEFSLHYRFTDVRAFRWFHFHEPELGRFQLQLRYTALCSLPPRADGDVFLANARYVRRSEVKRALRAGFRFELEEAADVLHALLRLTLRRQDVAYDVAFTDAIRAIPAAAISRGFGELGVVRNAAGDPAAAALFLYDAMTATYAMAGNDPDQRADGAATLAFAKMAERAMVRGCTSLDVGGVNSPNRGDFKTSFNAVPTPYFDVAWSTPDR